MKILAFALLLVGETLVIYAEEMGAKVYTASAEFSHAFLVTLPALLIGALLLVSGYMLVLKYFQNIWIVTAISFGLILVLEPLFNFFYIGQAPTLGSGLGVVFGTLGILSALFL
jgi:hypothetical protein